MSLPPPPVSTPITQANGIISEPWRRWFQQAGPEITATVLWSQVGDKPTTFPPSAHGHPWTEITAKPTEFPPEAHNQAWSTITNLPAGFPPESHRHPWSQLDNIPTEFPPDPDAPYWLNIEQIQDAKEATGFVDPDLIDISYDSTERAVTVTHPSGIIERWWRGEKKTWESPWTSPAHDNTNGSWFLYSTDGDNFAWSATVWQFTDIMVASVYFGATDKFCIRECHGMMDWNSHQNWHIAFGTLRTSGGTLTAGTFALATATDAATTPGVDASTIKDEDIPSNLSALTEGTYTHMYPSGASTMDFTLSNAFPFVSAGSYIQWYNGSTLTTGVTGRWYNVYLVGVPATSDAGSQAYRYLWLQPMAELTSLALAQAENPQLLDLRDFKGKSAEYVFLQRITYSSSAANGNAGKVTIASTQALSLVRGPAI